MEYIYKKNIRYIVKYNEEYTILKNALSYKFFIVWVFFIPINSFVIEPSIKGSLISYAIAFISPFIVLMYKNIYKRYFIDLFKYIYIWLFFFLISQLGNSVWNIDISSLILVNATDLTTKIFRSSIFTQSLYLLPGILLFLYAKYFYTEKWDKWIIYSGFLFSMIGLYFWMFFFVTGENGDFFSNRIYGDGFNSWHQNIIIHGMLFQRLQSLSGEPSMYAFTMLPYLIFAIHRKAKKYIIFIIAVSLVLSTSTTAYLGIIIYFLCLMYFNKFNRQYIKFICMTCIVFLIIYIMFYSYINDVITNMIINKITNLDDPNNISGMERSTNFYGNILYWYDLDIMHMLFGIGFGVIRSTDLFTTFLINIGLIGTIIFSYFYLNKIKIKKVNFEEIGNNSILLVVFLVAMISVSEFSYLSFWLFLGIIKSKYITRSLS